MPTQTLNSWVTDPEVAQTLIDVAAPSHDAARVRRNPNNARVAYDTVLDFMTRMVLTETERRTVEEKLADFERAACCRL